MSELKVLIVDDEPEISGFIVHRLSIDAPHFEIATVESADDCLAYIERERVDCIISDYQMRGKDGMELLKELRGRGCDMPFIFITGQGSEEVAREAFKNGADDYFTKEIGFAHFPRIVNSIERAVRKKRIKDSRADTQKALAESEEKLRIIAETALDAIVMIDESDRISYWNAAAERIFGYARDEALGHDLHEMLMPPEAHAAYLKRRAGGSRSEEGLPVSGKTREFTAVRKGGNEFPVEISLSSVKVGDRWHYVGVIRDITERRQVEDALRDSEQRYKDLVELSPDFIYRSDKYGNEMFLNDAALKMLGISLEEAVGEPWDRWIHPEDRERSFRAFEEMVRTGGDVFNFENRFVSRNGKVYHVLHNVRVLRDARGEVAGTQGIARDITERKLAEEALKESESRFRGLVEESLVGVYIIQDMQFSYVNPRAAEIFGYSPEEMSEDVSVGDVLAPEDRERAAGKLGDLMKGETGNVYTQFRGLRKGGSIINLET
ncbi:MAG TPA: PAS domain S-box protein, partial [Nitrospirota bacterium]|nr:PAS domain S-box protein [Nitrospirota bacterium]